MTRKPGRGSFIGFQHESRVVLVALGPTLSLSYGFAQRVPSLTLRVGIALRSGGGGALEVVRVSAQRIADLNRSPFEQLGDFGRRWLFNYFGHRGELKQASFVDDGNSVGHRERFGWVVRYENHRRV